MRGAVVGEHDKKCAGRLGTWNLLCVQPLGKDDHQSGGEQDLCRR